MAQLACQPFCTQQKPIVAYHAAANAGADGQIDKVMMALAGAKTPFTHCCQVCIVSQRRRYAEFFPDDLGNGNAHPFREIGRGEDHPFVRIDGAWDGNTDGMDGFSIGNHITYQAQHAIEGGFII